MTAVLDTTTGSDNDVDLVVPAVARGTAAGRPGRRPGFAGWVRTRAVGLLLAVLATLGVALVAAPSAAAWTTSSVGSAAATSYGIECSGQWNYVRLNWPNISVRSAANQNVYVRGLLYKWNGKSWVHVRTSSWYNGVSNVTGRKIIQYFAGQPYYFAKAGHPSILGAVTGITFTHLPRAYYSVVEQYRAGGKAWQIQTHYEAAHPTTATPTYCVA